MANFYLKFGEEDVAKAWERFGVGETRRATENALYAIEMLARTKRLIDYTAPRIESAVGDFTGWSLNEDERKGLRNDVANDRKRMFDLEDRLDKLNKAYLAKGDRSIDDAFAKGRTGDVEGVIREQRKKDVGPRGPSEEDVTKRDTPPPDDTDKGKKEPKKDPKDTVADDSDVTDNGDDTVTMGKPPTRVKGKLSRDKKKLTVTSPPYPAPFTIQLDTKLTNAAGVQFYQTTDPLGVWVIPPGVWIKGATLIPGPPPRLRDEKGREYPLDEVRIDTSKNPPAVVIGDKPVDPKTGDFPPKDTPPPERPSINNVVVDDSDLSDGVFRRYSGGKGQTLLSEQKISMAKNADGSPKVDGSGKLTLDLGERRVWTLRVNGGEQKTVDGRVQQVVSVVDGGGSTAFNITGWEAKSSDGKVASVEPSRTNPAEAIITFPGNGTYDIVASGTTTGWEKGSSFKVKSQLGVAQ